MKKLFLSNRREFLFSVAGVLGATLGLKHMAWAGTSLISESDPMAMALKYKHDASKVDAKANTQFKGAAKTNCGNCNFFTPSKTNSAEGSCKIFPTGLVSTKGWCASWSAKQG